MKWLERIAAGPVLLLDGATGTELERRGVRASLPLWSAHALVHDPESVRRVHSDYVAAGADLLTANTFRTQRRTLARDGLGERAAELTARAVSLARIAAGDRAAVLGSAPPLEDCFSPERVPDTDALAREHAEHARNLATAGADGVLVETMNTVREAAAAARAARDVGLPVLVSFTCWEGAHLLSREPLAEAIEAVRGGPLCGRTPKNYVFLWKAKISKIILQNHMDQQLFFKEPYFMMENQRCSRWRRGS